MIQALERLAEAARIEESIEDEHFALSRLVRFCPQEIHFNERLQEISAAFGLETQYSADQFTDNRDVVEFETTQYQDFTVAENEPAPGQRGETNQFDFAPVPDSYEFEPNGYNESSEPIDVKDFAFYSGSGCADRQRKRF